MAYGKRVAFEPIREIAFGSITGTYQAVGTGLADNARLIRIVNQMDTQMYISIDGTTDHIRLPAGGFLLLDLSANKIRDDGLFLAVGTIFYVKQVSAPSTGSLWIEVLYAEGGV